MKNLLIKNKLALRTAAFSVLLSIAFSLLPLAANAQTTEPPSRQLVMNEKTTTSSLPRLALVIGNAKYKNVIELKNASADAVDMAAALRAIGFEVIEGEDQNMQQMIKMIQEFGDKLMRQKGIGLLFYAGHGVQSGGRNWLIPVDADIPSEDTIEYSAVDVGRVLKKFDVAKNDLNIIILDACRNNPFVKEWSNYRVVGDEVGLTKPSSSMPKNTFLIYSAEPGKTASDGAGRNGLFTEVLLKNINRPLELDALYKTVSQSVKEKSKQQQTPYREGNFTGNFNFVEPPVSGVPPSPIVNTFDEAEPEIKEKDAATVERDIWNLVKNSKNAQEFREFLGEYPNGANAEKAKKILEQLVWDSIKASNDTAQVENYLKEFPNGANVKTANFRLRQLKTRVNIEPAKTEIAKVEPTVAEPAKTEIAKVEAEEVIEPAVKKVIVPKVEKPKVSATRAAKPKAKPLSGAGKFSERTGAAGIEFVQIPAGSFMMGSSEADITKSFARGRLDYKETVRSDFDNEKTQHRVTFADTFWIGKTEVTQAQWKLIMSDNPSYFKECDDCPVERISWEDAKKFVEKLNEANDGFEYSLPTEAQWEYAARGGKTGDFAGSRIEDMAWYKLNSENKTHPVGTLQPNGFGLFDIHGNVAEWCEDVYSPNYDTAPTDGTANTTGDVNRRVVRGGYYNDFPTNIRLPRRDIDTRPSKVYRSNNGLRVVAVEKQ